MFREVFTASGEQYIKFNDNQVEFTDTFMLYMITSLQNPHFSPTLHTRMKILNFSITKEGLQQQMLGMVCRHENQRDEDEREKLQRQSLEFKEQKRQIEDQILTQLRNAGQDILEDDSLVNSLNESKKITDDINLKLKSAQHVEDRIEENRKNYRPVALHAAKLYFAVQELSVLDPMYQFSMKWFRELFERSFEFSDLRVKEYKGRVKQLKEDFLTVLYENICRSIFEKHKLMFAFQMAIRLNLDTGEDLEPFQKGLKELDQHSVAAAERLSIRKVPVLAQNEKKSDQQSVGGMTAGGIQLFKSDEERLKIPRDELNYFLTGLVQQANKEANMSPRSSSHNISKENQIMEERNNPVESYMDSKTWQQVVELSQMDHFETLPDEIERNPLAWKKFVEVADEPIPEPFNSILPDFSCLLLFKVLKPEKTVTMVRRYIEKALGEFFVRPIITGLNEIFRDSKAFIPIILILTPGNDPMDSIKKLGEDKAKVPFPVSLGKGQGDKAKNIINEVKQHGGWVVLQNCHLCPSFLPELEYLIELMQPQAALSSQKTKKIDYGGREPTQKKNAGAQFDERPPNQDFRLWLTSNSCTEFPISILQNSIKVTSEPPKGVKSSLIRAYQQIDNSKAEREFFNSNSKPEIFRRLFLGLCFFHGVVRERRAYGPLGWNLRYDFNDSDFRISMRQLHLMVDTFEKVPFKALAYLTGECNYGGRVTDDWDARVLRTILADFYNKKTISQKNEFVEGQSEYFILQEGELNDYIEYVNNLPDIESPALVGLHENALINYSINEQNNIISDLLKLQATGGAGVSQESELVKKMAVEILYSLREPFKINEVAKKYPFKYEDSMNSVLLQELARFNVLIDTIKSSLAVLIKTLEGKLVMTADMERMIKSISTNQIPDIWRARSYPSQKPLTAYVKDLQERLQMFDDWIKKGKPAVYWISGFYFTQSFLTGVKQNFARKHRYPIDKVEFQFQVLKYETVISSEPEAGCYISGLFLEGAGWDDVASLLVEARPKELLLKMPTIYFKPELVKEQSLDDVVVKRSRNDDSEEEDGESEQEEGVIHQYNCPVYKTNARAGTLLTTGHSTNYILTIQLPSKEKEEFWTKRSVALQQN